MKSLTLENLEIDGACQDGLDWITPLLEGGGVSVNDWLKQPLYYLWAARRNYDIPNELLNYCAKKYPETVIRHALRLVTPLPLGFCAMAKPACATERTLATVTRETLDWSAQTNPTHGLKYVASEQTPNTLGYCAPGTCLE